MAGTEIGEYYAMPVILSFDGVDKQVNTKLGKVFGTAGKKAGKDFASGANDGLKDLEAGLNASRQSYEKLKDKASDALGKVRKEEAALQELRDRGVTSGSRFVAVEERLASARRNSDRATRDARGGLDDLARAQADLANHSDRTSGRLTSMGSSARAMGVIAGGAALAGVTALAAGVVVAGSRLYELGAQFDELSDTLQIKTGLSGAALDDLRSSVERLGTTNVPSTFAEIGDVAAEVTRSLHLTGPEFDAVTSRLANLSRMGVDVDIRALGKAFRGFGIDAADQAPALNSLYEASTKSGMSIDDMISAAVKGGPALRAFGLSFGESAALLSTFEEAGLDGEKGMAALTKAFAYFSKENIPAQEGLQRTIAEIQRLGDVPEAGALANKVFGAKGGAQFLEAIQSGNLDLRALSDTLGQTGLDINAVAADTADWSERWQTLQNDVAVALEPAATPLFDKVNATLDELSTWVATHQDEVIDFFVSIGEGAISAAEVTTTALAGVVDFLHLFDTAVMKMASWLPGYDDEAAKEFNDSLGDLSDKLNTASDSGLWKQLRDGLHDLGNEAKSANDTVGGLGSSVEGLNTAVNNMPETLPSWFPKLAEGGVPTNPGWFGGFGQPGAGLPSTALPPTSLDDLVATGGGGSGVGINLQANAGVQQQGAYGLPAGTDTGGYGTGNADTFPPWVMELAKAFNVKPSTYKEHQESDRNEPGYAPNPNHENRGIDWSGSVGDMERFAEYLSQNAPNMPGLEQIIWQNPSTMQKIGLGGAGNPTTGYFPDTGEGSYAEHQNHVHTRQSAPLIAGAPASPSTLASSLGFNWDAVADKESGGNWANNDTGNNGHYGGLQFDPQTWKAFGGQGNPQDATREQQIEVANRVAFTGHNGTAPQGLGAWEVITKGLVPGITVDSKPTPGAGVSPNLTNAYGAGYKPGIGTPGVNEYGDPGYYETDPRRIAQAERSVKDSDRRIADADQAVKDAEAKRDELDALTSEDDKKKADREVEKARDDAARAREDAQWAKEDLTEAQKGSFKQAQEAKTGSKGGSKSGGSGDLSGLGGIASSFLKETFGFGDFLPALDDNPWVKSGNAALSAFLPLLMGGGDAVAPGATTSAGAFGMPDTSAPPMPPAGVHPGTGALPGPAGPNISIDASINANTVGWDPAAAAKQQKDAMARALPRIPIGS